MKVYGESMFSFEFRSEEDRKQVLEMGSLHIASQLFILRPWKLFIEAEFNDLKTIPIWVVMKKFPMELWDDEGWVASKLRKLENKKKNGDKVWVQTGAIIVEEDEHVRGYEKQKEGGSLTDSNDKTMEPRDIKGKESVNEKHTEMDDDKWETPRKRHTARATTTAECEDNGMTVVQ
ncbi:hypothetical protein FRX31_022213, partial [Thalictrum thalictroides]